MPVSHRRSRPELLAAAIIFIAIAFIAIAAGARPALADPAEDVRSLLRSLVSVGGVPGHEAAVRAAIRGAAPTWVTFQEDNLGNLTTSVGSGKPVLLLLAHMDEPGYVVTGVTDGGYLKVQRLSRLPLPPLFDQFHMGQPLIIQTRRGVLPAVSVVPSTHLWRGDDSPLTRQVAVEDLLIDAGTRSAAEIQAAGIALLDPVVIARRSVDLAGGKLAGPALDDRAGCTALLWLLQNLEPAKVTGTLTIAFTTQAWVGGRGAARLANRIEADTVLVVDSPDATPGRTGPRAGKGPVVSVPTGGGLSQELYNQVSERAARLQIPLQNAIYGTGGEQASFAGRGRILALGAPVDYPGTPGGIVDAHDVLSLAAILKSIVEGER